MKAVSGAIAAALVLLPIATICAQEALAVLTEMQTKRGKIEVKIAGEAEWQTPKPLLSLRAGDQVRVIGDGRVVLVFTGGRGSQTVSQGSSPFTVQAPAGASVSDNARSVLGNVTNFLLGQQREKTYQSLSVRSVPGQSPVILSPRETRVLPGALVFDWAGSDRTKYRIRLLDSEGKVVWEHADLDRRPVIYPAGAPALLLGAHYTWELEALGTRDSTMRRASFDVLPGADAARVGDALAELTPGTAAGYPPGTLALMRAGLLFHEKLYADSRRELLAAIAAAPREPTLRLLLGHVYDRTSLKELAAKEFEEAEALTMPSP
jgi:hypothetical protein